jgi:predicted RNA methylase
MRSFTFAILLTASLPAFAQKLNPVENLGPDVPTPQSVVERMLEAGRVKATDTVYDLGSGDGRIVIAAAQIYGAKAVGVELRPDFCEKARERVKTLGLDDKVSIVEGNVLHVDLSSADVVTMYFPTSSNELLRPNLERWLKPGARVVSNQFPVKGWKAAQVVRVKSGSMEHTIYVYEVGKTK